MGFYPQESLYKPYKYHGSTLLGGPTQLSLDQRTKVSFSLLNESLNLSAPQQPSTGNADKEMQGIQDGLGNRLGCSQRLGRGSVLRNCLGF